MEGGINYYLKKTAAELFIKYDSNERVKINRSIDHLFDQLKDYFDDQINEPLVFGSYSRDTILPRRYDANSDIDILVQFNTKDYERLRPDTYRNQLKEFAQAMYPHSIVLKDHPSIVLELNHIKFDLVPAYFDDGIFFDTIEIPDKRNGWMETDPEKFSKKVTDVNAECKFIVKPIIRLIKYWNASHDYPYCSFELEQAIVEMDFGEDNYQTGFLHAVKYLPDSFLPSTALRQLDSLKYQAKEITNYLKQGEIEKAYRVLGRILPKF